MEWLGGLILLAIVAAPLLAIWDWYQSNGRSDELTPLSADETLEEGIAFFLPGGWSLEHRSRDSVFLRRGANGCTSLFLLVVFFPLGLVYLLTDWGKGALTISAWDSEEGGSDIQISWKSAGVRGQVGRLLDWLLDQETEGGAEAAR